MAVSLHNQYKEAILAGEFVGNGESVSDMYGNLNMFRDLCDTHPIPASEIIVITTYADGDWTASDLGRLIMRHETKRDLITAAFDKGVLLRTNVARLSNCLSEPHAFVMFLLEHFEYSAIRDWRDSETGETLLQRYMYAHVNITDRTSDEMALYMIETIGIDPLAGNHMPAPEMLIRKGYFRSIGKLISMGIPLGPIDKITAGIDSFIGNCVFWRESGYMDYHPTDLEQLAQTITTLTTAGYACVTDAIRQRITTNGFHEACPLLVTAIA